MQVCIRHAYHYGNVLINTKGVVSKGTLTNNTIPALLADQSLHYKPFGGAIENASVMPSVQAVKLVNITAFWWSDMPIGQGYEIPSGHAVKGFYMNGQYYIALKSGHPIHWPIERKPTNYHTDNVTPIR